MDHRIQVKTKNLITINQSETLYIFYEAYSIECGPAINHIRLQHSYTVIGIPIKNGQMRIPLPVRGRREKMPMYNLDRIPRKLE